MNTSVYVTIVAHTCWSCGVHFGLDAEHERNLRASGEGFYCPRKCHLAFGESEADKVRKQLATKERETARWQERAENNARALVSAEHRLRATRGVVTKIKRRVGKGVCPCCNRTFKDLARHMEGMHPEFGDTTPPTEKRG